MQHSYEGLDRPGGLGRGNLLSPLKYRDFRVLWAGMAVSLIGDGIFLVAVAWESYALWNSPASLAIVGIGMTVPTIAFLLVGGVISDRHDRRRVMICADGLRASRRRGACRARTGRRPSLLGTRRPRGDLRSRHCVLHAGIRVHGPAITPVRGAVIGQFARSVRAAGRTSARRSSGRRHPCGGLVGARVYRRRGVVHRFARGGDCHHATSRYTRHARGVPSGSARRGPSFRPPARLALGNAAFGGDRIPRVPRPGRGAPPVRRQERSPRVRTDCSGSSSRPEASAPSVRRSTWAGTATRAVT